MFTITHKNYYLIKVTCTNCTNCTEIAPQMPLKLHKKHNSEGEF